MMNDHRDELAEDMAAQAARSRDLARGVADIAGKIAETEEAMAVVHDDIAHADISAVAPAAAGRAAQERHVAEHERQEQQRWSAVAESGEPSNDR